MHRSKAPLKRLVRIVLITLACLLLIAITLPYLWIYGYLRYQNYAVRDHQPFAKHGVSQIAPAAQMDQLFSDCRHYITYGPNSPLFNSVAFFGDRYQLSMQVPVDIQSQTAGSMIGPPRFYLNEVRDVTVSPNGSVGASFSRSHDFDASDWQKIYQANGDFFFNRIHRRSHVSESFQKIYRYNA